jgi:CRISPR-associated protein Csx10
MGEESDPADASGCLTVRPARLPQAWRAELLRADDGEAELLKDGLVVTRFGVAIDDVTGVAADDTLRLVERARAGLVLSAEFQADLRPGVSSADACSLLQAGTLVWHHIGSSRRRGAGRVHIDFKSDCGGAVAVETGLRGTRTSDLNGRDVIADPLPGGAAMTRRMTLDVETLLPLICPAGVQGNVISGLDYLPGTTLLPLVASGLGTAAASLIRHGHLSIGNATVLLEGGYEEAAARAPLSIVSKNKGTGWRTDSAAVIDVGAGGSGDPGAKAIRGWTCVRGSIVSVAELSLVTTAHASIDDVSQRPLDDGLFTVEAIPAGTKLRSEIWATDAVDEKQWHDLAAHLNSLVSPALGRYRRGDYGLVRLTATVQAVAQADIPVQLDANGRFAVWLTSDAYLVDSFGVASPTANSLRDELAERLDCPELEVASSFVSVIRRDSWTNKKHLPRDSATCLRAGSVVVFRLNHGVTIDPTRWGDVCRRGIGGLCVEGFGRMRLLSYPITQGRPGALATVAPQKLGDATVNADTKWRELRLAIWRDALLNAAAVVATEASAQDNLISPGVKKNKSQLGNLREAARLLASDHKAVQRWCTAAKGDKGWDKETVARIRELAGPPQPSELVRVLGGGLVAPVSNDIVEEVGVDLLASVLLSEITVQVQRRGAKA